MLDQQISLINQNLIDQAQSYSDYRAMIDQLVANNQTTGPNQSEGYLEYTRMNQKRMNRWDKTAQVGEKLTQVIQAINENQTWLVITEAWCGDAAGTIPFINKLAELNPKIQLKLVLRDENPELMEAYLTEGSRSIPKLIVLNNDLSQELGIWGPRPEFLQNRLKDFKLNPNGLTSQEFSLGTHLWYAKDKNQSLEQELIQLFTSILSL
jgi:hypothetical protein